MEVPEDRSLDLDPFRGIALQVADHTCDITGLSESAKNVNMILRAADGQCRPTQVPADARKISMSTAAELVVHEKGLAMLRREYDVDVDLN